MSPKITRSELEKVLKEKSFMKTFYEYLKKFDTTDKEEGFVGPAAALFVACSHIEYELVSKVLFGKIQEVLDTGDDNDKLSVVLGDILDELFTEE